jgi:pyruvate/2-oxoglutarate dehydrogenase complex dihydrolipoamide acyltransferase (E2) component
MTEVRHDVYLPSIGAGDAGEVSEWYYETGAHVDGGEPVVAVDIDKAVVDVPAPAAGVLTTAVEVGAEVHAGDVLGWIVTDGQR